MEDVAVQRNAVVPGLPGALPTVSWRAVLAGVVVAVATMILLTTFGVALGATSLGVRGDPNAVRGVGVGVGIWYLISMIVSVFLGGVVAGVVGREVTRTMGAIEGLLVWALGLVLTVFLVTGGVESILSQAGAVSIRSSEIREQLGPQDAQRLANATAMAAWISFGTLLLSSIAGVVGGFVGVRFNRRRLFALMARDRVRTFRHAQDDV